MRWKLQTELVNRKDAINLLRNKNKLRELSQHNKNKMKSTKTYVNESLCPYYRKLPGKCNWFLEKNQLKSFYTINSKLKNKYDSDSGEVSVIVTHDKDLSEIFGSEMMSRVKSEHNPEWVRIMVALTTFKSIFIFIYELQNS